MNINRPFLILYVSVFQGSSYQKTSRTQAGEVAADEEKTQSVFASFYKILTMEQKKTLYSSTITSINNNFCQQTEYLLRLLEGLTDFASVV